MKKKTIIGCVAVSLGFISALWLCIGALFAPAPVFSQAETPMKIVVDAGHGGIDGGVTGKKTGVKESDLNLQIAYRVKDVLQDKGFEVVLTRKTEGGLYGVATKGFKRRDMEARKSIIQQEKPSYVLSLHQNFYPSKTSRGAQVFFNPQSPTHQAFATCIQTELNKLYAKENVKARKESKGEFYMLNCAEVPSALIECGFLSNEKDEKLLLSATWQTQLANAIATGVIRFLSESAT